MSVACVRRGGVGVRIDQLSGDSDGCGAGVAHRSDVGVCSSGSGVAYARDRDGCGAGAAHRSDVGVSACSSGAVRVSGVGDGVGSGAGSAHSSAVGVAGRGAVVGVEVTSDCMR